LFFGRVVDAGAVLCAYIATLSVADGGVYCQKKQFYQKIKSDYRGIVLYFYGLYRFGIASAYFAV
jgi:hypothetical protein